MVWWQWLFFCLGAVTAFSLAFVLATIAVRRWVGRISTATMGRSTAAPEQPEPRGANAATSTEASIRSTISTEARVG
jgi:hypothetical protein